MVKLLNIQEFSLENVTLPSSRACYLGSNIISDLKSKENNESQQTDCEIYSNIQFPFARTVVHFAPIKNAKILCEAQNCKKVVELTLDVSELSCEYLPGDTISILPQNTDADVKLVLQSLQLTANADNICNLFVLPESTKKSAKLPTYLPARTTPRKIFKCFLNLRSIPKKLFLRTLADYTTDKIEKKFLETICSIEGNKFYTNLIQEKQITFIDILKYCPSCHPPLAVLIEHLPRLLPRPYSIANSPLILKKDIRIIFSILQENTGLTTKFLENLAGNFIINPAENLNVALYFREPNHFRYTEEEFKKNHIMISVGCAISPFVGFLQHKSELSKVAKHPGQSWLFSGFKSSENCLYSSELNEFKHNGILQKWFECYSQNLDSKWKYVQDAIMANQEDFVEFLLRPETKLFICADGAEISKSIKTTISECLEKVLNCTSKDIDEMLKKFRKDCKYCEDIWL